MKLTVHVIANLACPPGKMDQMVFDDTQAGLAVRVAAAGGKNYLVQSSQAGPKKCVPLGPCNGMSLAAAREAASGIMGDKAKGADPAAERKAAITAAQARTAKDALTPAVLVEDRRQLHLSTMKPRYATEAVRAIHNAFADYLHLPAASIDRPMVVMVTDAMRRAGSDAMAARTVAYAKACYHWAVTGLQDLLARLVPRALTTANTTAAAIVRTIEVVQPTLLIDEADMFLIDNDEMRGVLNSGHRRSCAFVLRLVGDDHEPRKFSTWAATAIAMIGRLPDTLEDRSIVVRLRRRRADEAITAFRVDRSGGSATEAGSCTAVRCHLWVFRAGVNPWRAPASEAQKEAARANTVRLRNRDASPSHPGSGPQLFETTAKTRAGFPLSVAGQGKKSSRLRG